MRKLTADSTVLSSFLESVMTAYFTCWRCSADELEAEAARRPRRGGDGCELS